MPTVIFRCNLLLGCRRNRLGHILIAQKRFRQSATIFDDEYRIWRRWLKIVYKAISRLWQAKHIPDVVSVPDRNEFPLSIDPSNPSVDKLLSANWPPAGLCSGIETTRCTMLGSGFPVDESESSGREKILMVACLFVDGLNWGNLRGFTLWDPSVFKIGETSTGEWLYAGEAWQRGERTRESLGVNEVSSENWARNSASGAVVRDCSREAPACTPLSV